jgi:hypothetical protein
MKLSKCIPSRTKTIRFNWVKRDFLECTEKYINRKGTMLLCDWCRHRFQLGEIMGLAQPASGQEGPRRNWVLCQKCCDEMGVD